MNELKKFHEEMEKFFNQSLITPNITEVNSRETFDKILKRTTEKWEIGRSRKNEVLIFSKEWFKENLREERYYQVLKHEMFHCFYNQVFKTNKPIWLNEGLANFLAGKKINYDKVEVLPEDIITLFTIEGFRENPMKNYDKAQKIVKILFEALKHDKL